MTTDASARHDAVVRTDRNIVLRASAGTGKTTILVERLAYLFVQDKVRPDDIVAITFTETAAAEMKSRLRQMLHGLARWAATDGETAAPRLDPSILDGGPAKLRQPILAALDRLDRATVDTIHGFAGRLLRMFPEEAEVDAAFSVEDDPSEEIARDWAEWSRRELASDGPRLARWRPVLRALSWPQVEAMAARLADFEDPPVGLREVPKEAADFYEAKLADLERLVAASTGSVSCVEEATKALALLKLLKKNMWKGLTPGEVPELRDKFPDNAKKCGWSEEDHEAAAEAWSVARSLAEVREEASEAIDLLAEFAEFHRSRCLRDGRVSFRGMLTLARDLLRGHAHVRARFKKHRFLVDEFQDTDATQAEIVLRLASDGTGDWRALTPREGSLFVVGDAKQSIYGWRGADLGVFERVAARLTTAGALDLELVENFRCQPDVVAAANAIFASAFRPDPGLQAAHADLVASRPARKLTGRIVGLQSALIAEGDKAPDKARAEGTAIASWITQSRGRLKIEVEEDGVKSEKGLRFRDVAILLRASTYLQSYLNELRHAQIPYVVTREQHFYEAQEVRDAINLLLALARPDDALSLSGVLRSPVGGLTFDEIHALGRPHFADSPPGRAGELFQMLRSLRHRALRLPLAEAVGLILDESGLRAAAAASAHGDQALANLEKVASLAARAAGDLSLGEFADRLGEKLREEEREAESPLGEPDDDVVRVSTIHCAKGLEWPVVILAGLHSEKRNGGREESWIVEEGYPGGAVGEAVTPAYPWLAKRRQRRSQAEETRLFYVAATRAREGLIFSRAGTKDGAFLSMVPSGVLAEVPPPLPAGKPSPRPAPTPPPPADVLDTWKTRREEWDRLMTLPAIDSPSGLMHREDPREEAGHAYENRPSQVLGILVHRVLERWNFAGGDLDAAIAAAATSLLPEERIQAAPRAKEMLLRFFESAEGKEIAASTILGREIPFMMPWEGRTIAGVIDLLYEKDGRLEIRDYKTGKEVKRYDTQRHVYVQAVTRLFPDREVAFKFIPLGIATS